MVGKLTNKSLFALASKTQLLSLFFYSRAARKEGECTAHCLVSLLRGQKLQFHREAVITLMGMAEGPQTQVGSSGYQS